MKVKYALKGAALIFTVIILMLSIFGCTGNVGKIDTKATTEAKVTTKATEINNDSTKPEDTASLPKAEENTTEAIDYIPGEEIPETQVVTNPPATAVVTEAVTSPTVAETEPGRQIVSKQAVYDCDGSGHGYYIITYSDGTVEYEDF